MPDMPGVDNGAGFTLRVATDADVPTITALLKEAFAEQATLAPPSGALSETDEKVREVMRAAGVLLAVVDGAIVGCVFHEIAGDALYLFRLAVLPAYRRRGIARALLDAGEEIAGLRGIARTRLGVRLALPVQRAWYERRGYRVVSFHAHPGFTAPTSAVLEKDLAVSDG